MGELAVSELNKKADQALADSSDLTSRLSSTAPSWRRVQHITLRMVLVMVIVLFAPVFWAWLQDTGERIPSTVSSDEIVWRLDEPMQTSSSCSEWHEPKEWSRISGSSDALDVAFENAIPIQRLNRIQEVPLWCGPDQETYRFIYLPTFSNAIVVRVSVSGERMTLIGARFDGQAGFEFDTAVLRQVSRALSPKEVFEIRRHLGRVGFGQPVRYRDEQGLDGSTWIFEGRRDGRYQRMERWSPEAGAERDFGLALIRMSGLTTASDDVY